MDTDGDMDGHLDGNMDGYIDGHMDGHITELTDTCIQQNEKSNLRNDSVIIALFKNALDIGSETKRSK